MSQDTLPEVAPRPANLAWLDIIKAIALLWIGLNHVVERLMGAPYFANPGPTWPALSDRIQQVLPMTGHGWADLPLSALRMLGWTGDQGVQLFLITSGLGCTWSLCQRYRGDRFPLWDFYKRRLGRIYPLWWVAHFFCLPLAIWASINPDLPAPTLTSPLFYFSFLGLRFVPGTFYYFSVPWWFIGLILQLYLVYPLLWQALRRLGPAKLLLLSCGGCFLLRGLGMALLPRYIDPINRGFLFPMRLPEFVLGMSLAVWLSQDGDRLARQIKALPFRLLMGLTYIVGLVASFTLLGMAISPFLLGGSAFMLLYGFISERSALQGNGILKWISRHSFSLFLCHQFFINLLVPAQLDWSAWWKVGGAIALTAGTAIMLELVTQQVVNISQSLFNRRKFS